MKKGLVVIEVIIAVAIILVAALLLGRYTDWGRTAASSIWNIATSLFTGGLAAA